MEQRFTPDSINNIERDGMKLKASFCVMGKSFWPPPPPPEPWAFLWNHSHKYERFSAPEWYVTNASIRRGRRRCQGVWYIVWDHHFLTHWDDGVWKSQFSELYGVFILRLKLFGYTWNSHDDPIVRLLCSRSSVVKVIICILYRGDAEITVELAAGKDERWRQIQRRRGTEFSGRNIYTYIYIYNAHEK